ncbi:MAG: hypothetical protein U5K74_15440 [Gemmatimonadaceae bacterium]|nr:hypothetical protein [Gemmatimonadaceae bacterium]
MLFNAIVPAALGFQNKDMKKKVLGELVFESYRRAGLAETVAFLDRLKEFGFRNATLRRRVHRHRRPAHPGRRTSC